MKKCMNHVVDVDLKNGNYYCPECNRVYATEAEALAVMRDIFGTDYSAELGMVGFRMMRLWVLCPHLRETLKGEEVKEFKRIDKKYGKI